MKIFAEVELRGLLQERHNKLLQEVQSADKNYLLNVNETQYINYLVDRYHIEPLILYRDQVSVSDREEMIPAERFPHSFHVYEGKRYAKQVVTYHLPYSGEEILLKCAPSQRLIWTEEVRLEGGSICYDIINWQDDAGAIKNRGNNFLNNICQQADFLTKEIAQYNSGLENQARQIVQGRKALLLKQMNLLSSLGVPFYKAQNVPPTFAVPVIQKRIIIKPSAATTAFTPEPTLDESSYRDVLQIIHETGTEMERHPSIYQGKDEETLRDHFIMVLSPHFQSVTGETFNKTGKTDILIRHEKQNIFVAEYKFWKGIKTFYGAIDQLLGYLTWRDSKAALICFVENKELNPVLQQIESETANHPCYVKYYGKQVESWFSFEFHLKEDHTRSVRLAILCFHFP